MRIIASWACYWAGDVFERVTWHLGHWFEWPYRGYQTLMCWAMDLQGNDPRGPWQVVRDKD